MRKLKSFLKTMFFIIVGFGLIPTNCAIAQKLAPMPDSTALLQQLADHPENDTSKVVLLYKISDVFVALKEYSDHADESVVYYYLQALDLAIRIKWDRGIMMGERALSWQFVYLKTAKNKQLIASVLNSSAKVANQDLHNSINIYAGIVYNSLKNYQAAISCYTAALTYFTHKSNIDRMLQLPELLSQPYNSRSLNQPEKVDELLNNGLALARVAGNKKYIAHYLCEIADAGYGFTGNARIDRKKAMAYYQESLNLAEETGDETYIYNDIFSIGFINDLDKQYYKNVILYKKGIVLAKIHKDVHSTVVLYGALAGAYAELKDYSEAEHCYNLQVGNANIPTDLYAAYTGERGYYLQRFNYLKAIEANEKALFYVKKTDRVILQYFVLMDLGDIYNTVGNSSKAVESYDRALNALTTKAGPNKSFAGIVASYKGAALADEQPKTAITYLNQSLREFKRADWDLANYSLLSVAWYNLRNYSKALAYAQMGVKDSIGSNLGYRAKALRIIGSVLRDAPDSLLLNHGFKPIKRYQEALGYINRSRAIVNNTGDPTSERDNWKELSLTYDKLKSSLAYPAYRQYIIMRDSVNSRQATTAFEQREADVLFKKNADSLKAVQQLTDVKLKAKQAQSYYFIAGILVLIGISVFIFRTAIKQRRSNRLLSAANGQISREKQRSDDLLLNILPADVAEELKEKGSADAKLYDEVTVLFTDFVNFTTVSQSLTPQQLVDELNVCFKAFDEIMTTHKIEKIKTVGDAYLAVSGLPNADLNHAANVINAAKDIQQFMLSRKKTMGDKTFGIRLGVHSGSVVAGIVGVKKFAYDIWGDTVNTAARMEQNSEPGKINVSEKTYELVKDRFIFTYRGEIAAKNKGMMKMYFAESTTLT